MLSSQLRVSLQAGLALPTPISPTYSWATFWNQEKLVLAFETNPDFLELCEGEWHRYPSALILAPRREFRTHRPQPSSRASVYIFGLLGYFCVHQMTPVV